MIMNFVKKPNLPTGEVLAVAISSEALPAINSLASMGIRTITVPSITDLPKGIASHADLQLLHLFDNRIISGNEQMCAGELTNFFNVVNSSKPPKGKYPADVVLNTAIIGRHMICNTNTVDPQVLQFAESSGLAIHHVNQGYTKCSICIINENAIITDDTSIAQSAQFFLDDVTFVEKGSIGLHGYSYGFIGGCCGKIAQNKIAFNGRIESHSDANKIIDALARNKTEAVELTNETLYDIGGILPLIQKSH